MSTHHQVKLYREEGEGFFVRCPKCACLQPFPPDGMIYRVYENGAVYPVWVCMEPTRECDFEGYLFVTNHDQLDIP